MHTETTSPEPLSRTRGLLPAWRPGVSPNPGGKPTAARNRLTTRFLHALADDFDEHGKAAIVEAREKDPVGYIKAIVALCPKEFVIERPLGQMSDDELIAFIDTLREAVGHSREPGGGTILEGVAQQVEPVPAIPQAG